MKDNLIRATVTVFAAVAVVTAFWIGLGVGTRSVEVAAPEPVAGNGGVYSMEIWENTGEARIMTTVPYVQQIDERTVIVTNRDMRAVIEDIQAAVDRGDVK